MSTTARSCARRLVCWLVVLMSISVLGTGCSARATPTADARPTVAPVFSRGMAAGEPGRTSAVGQMVPTPTLLGRPDVNNQGQNHRAIAIFDDTLSSDWSLDQSLWMRYNLTASGVVKSGRYAIQALPTRGYSSLFFTVRPDARRRYEERSLLGVRFWVNGGPYAIGPEDLIVTVMGSNAFPYFRPDDTSVRAAGRITDGGTIFDEQRLYFLGFREGIPANTWAEVIVWFEERVLDPEYVYLTGLYIKNDEFFVKPFYVDGVSLILADQ